MSAISEVKICNLALTRLGETRITSLAENSEQARSCNAIYEEIRDEVLSDHPWNFAQKRATLATLSGEPVFTDDGMTVQYQKPTDCIKITHVNISFARIKLEGDRILSDTSGLKIKYTFRNTDPQKYFPKFIMAFATRLAAELAYGLTSSRTLAADLLVEYYDKRLPQAMSIDSQQGTPLAIQDNEWLGARMTGSSSIAGRTGQEIWTPCW